MKHLTLSTFAVAMFALQVAGASGHAVSVLWRNGANCPENGWSSGAGASWRGTIIRHDVSNNQVTHHETIFDGVASYPTLNVNGDKVAFARWGCYLDNGQLAGDCNSGHLSVMDIDGGNVRNLVSFDVAWEWQDAVTLAGDGAIIEWPVGDWIYYEKPTKTCEIWRVNVNDPSRNEFIVKYVGNAGATHNQFYFRRWSLSLDAKYAGGQFKDGTCGQNLLHNWVPAGGSPCDGRPSGSLPGCNMTLSASGSYSARYGSGWHTTAAIQQWDHGSNSVNDEWANPAWNLDMSVGGDVGVGAAYIRWSANSDKWLCQAVGWYGHESSLRLGSNQLIANWKDKQGFLGSNNPKQTVGGASPTYWESDGVTYLCSDAGDFWVQPPSGQTNVYEDIDGNWHQVQYDGVDVVSNRETGMRPGGRRVIALGQGFMVSVHGIARVQVLDTRGRRLIDRQVSGTHEISLGTMAPGAYTVLVDHDGAVEKQLLSVVGR